MATVRLNGDAIHYEFDPENKSDILGQGGMGIVFKGKRIDDETGSFEFAAIKVLFSDLSDESILRAKREASIQVIHENIVRMYGFVETTDKDGKLKYHVISEYLDGITLDKILNQSPTLPKEESIKIVINILSALYMLHSKGYIHRDIDPSNVMICKDGRIKIIDFGIAKQLMEYHDDFKQGTQEGKFIGKINYASPEQAEGKHWITNATSDIYSTGILLYELVTGKLPFNGTTYEIIQGHREKPIPACDTLSKDLQYIITKATAKEQVKRYQSAAEFIVDLEKYQKGISVIPNKPKWVWVVAAAIMVVLMCSGAYMYSASSSQKSIHEAEQLLSVGLYNESLDLFNSVGFMFKSESVEANISMLNILVSAVDRYNNSDYIAADSLFNQAIILNSPDAYYYLGEMCFEGIGTPKNFKAGLEYSTKSAELGNKLAEYRLGLVYSNGLGVKTDIDQASKYFESAGKVIDRGVDNKNPELLFIKGSMYLNGNYVQKNINRAREYYEEASLLGYPQAQYELYKLIKNQDNLSAIGWLEKSASKGYPKAEYEMGVIAELNKEYSEALKWMKKSASKNYSPSFQWWGTTYSAVNREYAKFFNIDSDDTISHNYSLKALEYDFENIDAMLDLWWDYRLGRGVEKDLAKAQTYKDMVINKLNELSYSVDKKGNRVYLSSDIQDCWDTIQ